MITAPRPIRRAAREARLGHHDRRLADHDVVSHLHQVVELRAPPDAGVAERAAIDRRVRADLDVVLHHHASELRHRLELARLGEHVAEAVAAEHDAGLQHDAIADLRALAQHATGVDHAVGADHARRRRASRSRAARCAGPPARRRPARSPARSRRSRRRSCAARAGPTRGHRARGRRPPPGA